MSGLTYSGDYLTMINALLASVAAMQSSVKKIEEAKGPQFVATMKWGDYQSLLKPADLWPNGSGNVWPKVVQRAREDLMAQLNYSHVSRNDSRVPPDKCQLLDESVRRCFMTPCAGETARGIPIHTDVLMKSADDPTRDRHEVQLVWTYDWVSLTEKQLNYVMICPYDERAYPR